VSSPGGRVTGRPQFQTEMTIPHDLLDEIHRELQGSSRRLTRECNRLAELIELDRLALVVSIRLGRPVSVRDLFDDADDARAARLAVLVRSLRGDARAADLP
jgi:hypothetical protein